MEKEIIWEITDRIDCHGCDYWEVALTGYDEDGNEYQASGYAMGNEIEDIWDIECVSGPKLLTESK